METLDRDFQGQHNDWDRNEKGPNAQDDSARMGESLRQVQTDAERARAHSEQMRSDIEELRAELRGHSRRGWATVVLAVVLLGAAAYGYFVLKGHGSVLARLPAVQSSLDSVGRSLRGTQEELRTSAINWSGLSGRVDQLQKSLGANLKADKDFAVVQAAKVQQQVQSEMDNRTRATDAKLSQLESSQQNDQVQIATLQQELSTARSEARQQLASAQAENGREFGSVRNDVNQAHDGLEAMARNLERQRVDFEVTRQQSHELAPGLALTVLKTDVDHQQVDGYLRLVPEGRTLWLHGQGIEQPMLFHSQDDQRTYEVVFTRVGGDGAVGYVLTPRWPAVAVPTGGQQSSPELGWQSSTKPMSASLY